jgi:hypothetical protein
VFFRLQSKGIHVNTGIRRASVVLEGLNKAEVRTLTLRETVLAVKLKLGGNNGVLSPTVEAKGGLTENEGAGITYSGTSNNGGTNFTGTLVKAGGSLPLIESVAVSGSEGIHGTSILEKSRSVDKVVSTRSLLRTTESGDGRRKSINGISVVEGLGTESLVKNGSGSERRTVINVGIRLNNPNKFLARMVEVELNLVAGRTDGLITSELKLLNEVLVGVLCHLSALISVKENEVKVERSGNKGLLVSKRNRLGSGG